MSKVTKLPTRGVSPQVTARQIWDAPQPTDKQVWAVCPYLRDHERCKGCPEWEETLVGGEVAQTKRMCRALAEEVCRIVEAAKA